MGLITFIHELLSTVQNNREPEEDFMTDESSQPTGDSGESQNKKETPQLQWTKKQVKRVYAIVAKSLLPYITSVPNFWNVIYAKLFVK